MLFETQIYFIQIVLPAGLKNEFSNDHYTERGRGVIQYSTYFYHSLNVVSAKVHSLEGASQHTRHLSPGHNSGS